MLLFNFIFIILKKIIMVFNHFQHWWW